MSPSDAGTSGNDTGGPHLFTVDVEEYYHVYALREQVDPTRWNQYQSRVESPVRKLLELLDRKGYQATFFVLGWLARRHPTLVREIDRRGHEVASHGWSHRRIVDLEPEEFREEVARSKSCLEDIVGVPVVGYRAPSFSLVPGTEWVYEILAETGYRYDSSIFPIRRPGSYGYPNASRDPHSVVTRSGTIEEYPLTTLDHFGVDIPAAGGAYFRHLPYWITRAAFRRKSEERVPGVFYIHSWELDPDQPRLDVPWLTRLRHYGGLEETEPKLERILSEFQFTSVSEYGLRNCSGSRAADRSDARGSPI